VHLSHGALELINEILWFLNSLEQKVLFGQGRLSHGSLGAALVNLRDISHNEHVSHRVVVKDFKHVHLKNAVFLFVLCFIRGVPLSVLRLYDVASAGGHVATQVTYFIAFF